MLGGSEVTMVNYEQRALASVLITLFSCTNVPVSGSVQVTLYVIPQKLVASLLLKLKFVSKRVVGQSVLGKFSPNLHSSSVSVRLSGDRSIYSLIQFTIVMSKFCVKATSLASYRTLSSTEMIPLG